MMYKYKVEKYLITLNLQMEITGNKHKQHCVTMIAVNMHSATEMNLLD